MSDVVLSKGALVQLLTHSSGRLVGKGLWEQLTPLLGTDKLGYVCFDSHLQIACVHFDICFLWVLFKASICNIKKIPQNQNVG